ncbi:MAG: hypothetical protein MJ252_18900, partial [archaeon]|nr:hypothetical protein [archaeon]
MKAGKMQLGRFNVKQIPTNGEMSSLFQKNVIGTSDKFKDSGQTYDLLKNYYPQISSRFLNNVSNETYRNPSSRYNKDHERKISPGGNNNMNKISKNSSMRDLNSKDSIYFKYNMAPHFNNSRERKFPRYNDLMEDENNLYNINSGEKDFKFMDEPFIRPPNEKPNLEIKDSYFNNHTKDKRITYELHYKNLGNSARKQNVSGFLNSSGNKEDSLEKQNQPEKERDNISKRLDLNYNYNIKSEKNIFDFCRKPEEKGYSERKYKKESRGYSNAKENSFRKPKNKNNSASDIKMDKVLLLDYKGDGLDDNFSGIILKKYNKGKEIKTYSIKQDGENLKKVNSVLQLNMFKINEKLLQFVDTEMKKASKGGTGEETKND